MVQNIFSAMVFLDGAKNAALWILIGIVVTELTLFLGPRSALGQRIPVRGDWLYWIWVVMWPAPGIHLAMTLFFFDGIYRVQKLGWVYRWIARSQCVAVPVLDTFDFVN